MALSPERMAQVQKALEGLSPEEQQKKLPELLNPEELGELKSQQCPFCLIIAGKIPANKVYEDDIVMAVLDINPANPGHTIVFPKQHYGFMFEMPDNELTHLFKVSNELAKVIFEVLGCQGTNIFIANGPAAGQTAPHTLINVIPRYEKDEVQFGWNPKKVPEEQFKELANKIASKKISLGGPAKIETPEVIVETDDSPHAEEQERIP